MNNRSDTPWSTLLNLLRAHRWRLGMALLFAICASAVALVPYILLCRSAMLLLAGAHAGGFFELVGWLAAALAVKYLLYAIAYYISHHTAYRILMTTRQLLVRRLTWAPLTWLNQQGSGAIRKQVIQDVERLEQFIAHHLVEMTAAAVTPIWVVLVLVRDDWRLALAAVATLPLALLFQAIAMRGMRERMAEHQQAVGELNSATVEYLRGMPMMKVFRQDARSFVRMRDSLARYRELTARITRRAVPGWSVFMVLLNANIVLLLPVGLWLLEHGQIDFMGLLIALVLGNGMLKPLFKLMRCQTQIREILTGVMRMQPLLAMTEPAPRAPVAIASHALRFDGVSFRYGDKPILHDLSFSAEAGQMVALVGPSGAGKTTVANLLGGLIEPTRGEIRIGAVPLREIGEAQRAGLIAVVTQDTFLFRGSLLDNLRLGAPEADEARVREALCIAQAAAFVDALPDGWHTPVGERGVTLSGGERQRIAVARALLADAPILVLDESTAFLDSLTERRLLDALRAACPEKTLVVIAHRLYTVKAASQIIVMRDGRLLDAGVHDVLVSRCPTYRQMWQAQADSGAWEIHSGRQPNPIEA